jgi:hypothetical protein
MARSVDTIVAAMQADLAADPVLSSLLTSTSLTKIYGLWIQIVARCVNLFEQAQDIYLANNEILVNRGVYATVSWIQYEVTQFQYSATTAQAVQVNPDFSITYPTINTSLQIVSNCSVTTAISGLVSIKVATGNPPAQLSSLQVTALDSYLDNVLPPDLNYQIINATADLFMLGATIYYNGQYSAVIQTNVIAALNAYIASFTGANFNGEVKLDDIRTVVKNVQGVTDIVFNNVTLTPQVGVPTNLVTSNTVNFREIIAYAGYINNASAPNDFANTLTFLIG